MQKPPIPSNETLRLALVDQLDILDTDAEEVYDGIVYIACMICNTPVSMISIVDSNRQWFKSILGSNERQTPRDYSFCAHAILGADILEVPDSLKDDRFKDNPIVTGPPYVRFYAGAPLELKDGLRVGTLCVMDHKPNKLNEQQLQALEILGQQVTKLLELRLKIKEVEVLRENDTNIVNMLTHELRNPLTSIEGFLSYTKLATQKYHDSNYDDIIEKCLKNTERMLRIVNEFLNYSHWKDGLWTINKTRADINACISEGAALAKGYAEKCKVSLELQLDNTIPKFNFDYGNILNVLENLLSNAAKHSPEGGKVILSSKLEDTVVKIQVQDFGSGIPEKDLATLFKPFALYSRENRAGIQSSGLGLCVAKKIIEKHEGELKFDSTENQGTIFYFTLPLC